MFKKTLQATAFVSTALIALGASMTTESHAATVKQNVNMRKGSSTNHKVTNVLEKGTEVKILSESNGWYKVQNSDGEKGWSNSQFIDASDEEIENAKSVSGTVLEPLNFRQGPSMDEEIMSVHEKGSKVKVLSESNGWYKVKDANGQVGWSYAKYIKTSDKKLSWSNDDTNGTFKNTANMRKGASTNYDVIKLVQEGEKVKVISALDGWYKLQTSDGQIGWTHGSHVDSSVALSPKSASKSSAAKKASSSKNTASSTKSSGDSLSLSEVSSKKSMVVSATAYSGDSITSTGTTPKWGTIAVDPSIIPYGTKVYIPRFGKTFIAEDCGGAIKGNRIDIFMNSESQCNDWGRRNITIQIVD
ncbi:SH3 domain-containing protein [Terrisporobacter sp.]